MYRFLTITLYAFFLCVPAFAQQLLGEPMADESFSHALASGDFDNDGYSDLVVGVPGDISGSDRGGSIQVIYGGSTGLDYAGNQIFFWSPVEDGDSFGAALSVGDFNGDNFDDLAIGAPLEDVGSVIDAGVVNIMYGTATGLDTPGAATWTQSDLGYVDETSDLFGFSLVTGDFNNDTFSDLAIGTPREDIEATTSIDAGVVFVLYGSAVGLTDAGADLWTQVNTIGGTSDDGDLFGTAIAAGDFDGDSFDDLAIGVPGDSGWGAPRAGSISVIFGTASGLSNTTNQVWSQGHSTIEGAAEQDDNFGSTLVAGSFNADTPDDLAIGVPLEDTAGQTDDGAVHVLFGSVSGLSDVGDLLFTQSTAGLKTFPESEDHFGQSLAVGQFGVGFQDGLVIGIPGEDLEGIGVVDAGALVILDATTTGPDPASSLLVSQADANIEGLAENDDVFAYALSVGDYDHNGVDDIAIGVPNEDIGPIMDAGAANVFYDVFSVANSQIWYQGITPVAVEPQVSGLPNGHALLSAYPNPFNPATTIRYDVAETGRVSLSVHDVLGREVAVLVDEEHVAGHHEIQFDAGLLPSGVYTVRMQASGASFTRQISLVR